MIAVAMRPIPAEDFAIFAGQPGDGSRLEPRVERHEHLRLQAAAGEAGDAQAILIDFGQALQEVQSAHVVPNHIRLIGEAAGKIFVVVLRCNEDHESKFGQHQKTLLQIGIGVSFRFVAVGQSTPGAGFSGNFFGI